MTSKTNADIDVLLEQTQQRPSSVRPPTRGARPAVLPLLREWAGSQVAAYRVGLLLGYVGIVYFGATSFVAGIPVFEFTTPDPSTWTPIWATAVVIGGLIGAMGSIRAGSEPLTREVRVFNRIELVGAIALFLTLGGYAGVLLYVGYGFHDAGRQAVGAGFVALGVPFAIRMLWLLFRPRLLALRDRLGAAPVVIMPPGYAVFKVDENNKPLEMVVAPTSREEAGK